MLFYSAGGKPGAMQKCRTCNGRGLKITMRQLGPGMVQQMQSVCPDCHGEGRLSHVKQTRLTRALVLPSHGKFNLCIEGPRHPVNLFFMRVYHNMVISTHCGTACLYCQI